MKWPMWVGNDILDRADATPISDALKTDLRDWTSFYLTHFDDDWDTDSNAIAYNANGRDLAHRVAVELGPSFEVLLCIETSSVDLMEWVEIEAQ